MHTFTWTEEVKAAALVLDGLDVACHAPWGEPGVGSDNSDDLHCSCEDMLGLLERTTEPGAASEGLMASMPPPRAAAGRLLH